MKLMKYIDKLKKIIFEKKKNTMTQNLQLLVYYHKLKLHDCILNDRVSQPINSVDKRILKTMNERDKWNESSLPI